VQRVRIRELRPFTILAIGWVIGIIYAYPGVMTLDGNDQLHQGRTDFYTDGHPPAMAWMWRYVDAVIAGPFGMLVIQTVTFVAGIYLILRRAIAPRRAAVATVVIFLFPPVLSPMAAIWKDCIMAGFFVLGIALLLEDRRWVRVVGAVCLMVGTSVRYNALAATLPVLVLLLRWYDATTWKRRLASWGIATGAWIAITALPLAFNIALTDQKMYVWQSSLAVLDIAGTIAHVDEPMTDDELRAELADTQVLVDHDIQAAIRARYVAWDFDPLLTDGGLWKLPIEGTTPAPESQRDGIARAFWNLALDHPGAYLRHRLECFSAALGIHNRGGTSKLVRTHHNQYFGMLQAQKLATGWSPVQNVMQGGVIWTARHTPFFKAWCWAVIALCLLPLCRRQRPRVTDRSVAASEPHRDVLAILLSGLGLEATLFPLAPSPDFRYSHWMVVCTLIAIVMLTARRMREPPREPLREPPKPPPQEPPKEQPKEQPV